jgi:hypothetical protein
MVQAVSEPNYQLWDNAVWAQIKQELEADRKALQLREWYRNVSEPDKAFLKSLKIRWNAVNGDEKL